MMATPRNYVDLDAMARDLGLDLEELKKEMWLSPEKSTKADTLRLIAENPSIAKGGNSSIGGRLHLYMELASHYVKKR